ncbi:MAG TPA: HTTM domain-containing protein, partial [Myxococcota bacterium]|nr:HTTM domain-containing protein [Myxococcota bacterium]
ELLRNDDGKCSAAAQVLQDLLRTYCSGALPLIWGDSAHGGFRKGSSERLALLGGGFETVEGVALLTGISAFFLMTGLSGRLAAFVCLQGCLTLYPLNRMAGGGHDRVITNALWLLVLADSARTLSLSARRRTGRWLDPTPVPAWPRYLMVGQLVAMYTATGLQKVTPEWFWGGDYLAVYNMLLVPAWARWDLAPVLGLLAPLAQVATALTWLWESSFWVVGLWLLLRGFGSSSRLLRYDLRSGYAALGLCFHLGLLLLADLGPFSLISLALYPALYHPAELQRGPWKALVSKSTAAPG